MKRFIAFVLTMVLSHSALINPVIAQSRTTEFQTINFNSNWKFVKADVPSASFPGYNDSKWKKVDLPHDWSIEGPFDKNNPAYSRGAWLPTGICYYRKTFQIPAWAKAKKISIYFEGAYRNAEVWINGHYLGLRPFGYSSFFYDLTSYISFGKSNIITVKLDNSSQPGSRWYSGTGIYRNVKLLIRDKLSIPIWGTVVTTPVAEADHANVLVKSTIKNDYDQEQTFMFTSSLMDKEGNILDDASQMISLKPKAAKEFALNLKVDQPNLWRPDHPYLYTVKTTIAKKGKVIHVEEIKTGIRKMEYDAQKGFILNGEIVKLKGVCLHHDGGPLGAAIYRATLERQFQIMKEMGANAVRTSHNPMSEEYMDLCDSMGLLVLNEAFDEWQVPKAPPDYEENGKQVFHVVDHYASQFDVWAEKDLTDFVLRDRNHPCVFMWSLGNEIAQTQHKSGIAIARKFTAIVHKYDYRPTTVACNGYPGLKNPSYPEFISNVDVYGINYPKSDQLSDDHQHWPDRKTIITECVSAQPLIRRGDYDIIPDSLGTLEADGSDNGIGKGTPKYLNFITGITAWQTVLNNPNVMGMFIWTGMDFLGEVTPYPWPARSSFFGAVDLCGFPKDGFYFYKSQWTDRPMVHIFPHWNWKGKEGKIIPVGCFSNCDYVELFLNGKSVGRKQVNNKDVTIFNVPYQKGELRAVGYSDVGKRIAEQRIKTADEAYKIVLSSRKAAINADGEDLAYIECSVIDKAGNLVPSADNMIQFKIEGPAQIIGVGNGNQFSHEPFKANYRKAFNGKCLAIIKSNTKKGLVTLSANSAGLQTGKITIRVEQ
jgi:beta-galactosidase